MVFFFNIIIFLYFIIIFFYIYLGIYLIDTNAMLYLYIMKEADEELISEVVNFIIYFKILSYFKSKTLMK